MQAECPVVGAYHGTDWCDAMLVGAPPVDVVKCGGVSCTARQSICSTFLIGCALYDSTMTQSRHAGRRLRARLAVVRVFHWSSTAPSYDVLFTMCFSRILGRPDRAQRDTRKRTLALAGRGPASCVSVMCDTGAHPCERRASPVPLGKPCLGAERPGPYSTTPPRTCHHHFLVPFPDT